MTDIVLKLQHTEVNLYSIYKTFNTSDVIFAVILCLTNHSNAFLIY